MGGGGIFFFKVHGTSGHYMGHLEAACLALLLSRIMNNIYRLSTFEYIYIYKIIKGK